MNRNPTCSSGGPGLDFDRIQEECRWLIELAGRLARGCWQEPGDDRLVKIKPHFAALSVPAGWTRGIPMISLARSWERGKLVSACPKCGGRSYVMGAVARSFWGGNRWYGVCPDCGSAVAGRDPGPAMFWGLAAACFRPRNGPRAAKGI